ncbi:MAG: hypothetical protein RLO08_09660 [Parvibaculaceae bacterium]
MPEWISFIATSQFVWGTIIGLVLSMLGAYAHAAFQFRRNLQQQTVDFTSLCVDVIRNIVRISEDVQEARRRSRLIHSDLLALFDAEVNIFGRNREFAIRLDNGLRDEVRKFVTNCALRRSEIGMYLATFQQSMELADRLRASGDGPQSERVRVEASDTLVKAHKAMDDFISTAERGNDIISKLQK